MSNTNINVSNNPWFKLAIVSLVGIALLFTVLWGISTFTGHFNNNYMGYGQYGYYNDGRGYMNMNGGAQGGMTMNGGMQGGMNMNGGMQGGMSMGGGMQGGMGMMGGMH